MSIQLNRRRSLDEFYDYCHDFAMQTKTYFAWINDAILDLLLRWSEMLAKVINR